MKTNSKTRDSQQTRRRILDAVGKLLAASGFQNVGINAIARQAQVDKVLIYRYFGSLPELLKAFAAESDFWPKADELRAAADAERPPDRVASAACLQVAFGRALRSRPLTQEILRWELLERNELTEAIAQHREQEGTAIIDSLETPDGPDVRAIGTLLSAGLTYLILRSKTASVYNGLRLDSEEDWERIERAAGFLVKASFQRPNVVGKTTRD